MKRTDKINIGELSLSGITNSMSCITSNKELSVETLMHRASLDLETVKTDIKFYIQNADSEYGNADEVEFFIKTLSQKILDTIIIGQEIHRNYPELTVK